MHLPSAEIAQDAMIHRQTAYFKHLQVQYSLKKFGHLSCLVYVPYYMNNFILLMCLNY